MKAQGETLGIKRTKTPQSPFLSLPNRPDELAECFGRLAGALVGVRCGWGKRYYPRGKTPG